jgi:formate dehydrogenase iron-sulfur subunit
MSPVQESPPANTVTLIDELLAEQRSLTAVARFARKHEEYALPAQARYYRDLIPLTRPRPGEQYAFEVDLDQCTGCKGCVTACHALNGLDDDESWRNVGLLVGGINGHAMQQTVTTACHHCVDPGCLNGCPVLAYEKDPVTGIVHHLDDQCIGCQYCVMKCPYDVPKYSDRLGIVRKCDLCHQRLAVGEAPACVQACPNEAIKISVVSQRTVSETYRPPSMIENSFLAGSPAPDYTLPTTVYKTDRPIVATLKAVDEGALQSQPAHWPLVFLLVLSQASVGMAVAAWFCSLTFQPITAAKLAQASAAAMVMALGIAALHLGRPMKAWRVFLGWRKSWFSREAIAFGGYLGTLVATTGAWSLNIGSANLHSLLGASAVGLGLVSVFCSLMLYVDTRREFWSAWQTGIRFGGSSLLLGLAGWIVIASCSQTPSPATLIILTAITLLKLGGELSVLRHGTVHEWTPLKRTARLLVGPLRIALAVRVAVAIAGGLALPLLAFGSLIDVTSSVAIVMFVLLFTGELAERYLFFTAVSPTRMPGSLPA